MIKNSLLLIGMPMTNKSTRILKSWITDWTKHGYYDLCLNLWTYQHRVPKVDNSRTMPYIRSPHGHVPALAISKDYHRWVNEITAFHNIHPEFDQQGNGHKVHKIFIDEAWCMKPVLLDCLCMILRDFYPNVKIVLTSIDFDSWRNKLPCISAMKSLVSKVVHLDHKCQLGDGKTADRRLHIIKRGHTVKPIYKPYEWNKLLSNPSNNGHMTMISVCSDHYYLNQSDLNLAFKRLGKAEHARMVKNRK